MAMHSNAIVLQTPAETSRHTIVPFKVTVDVSCKIQEVNWAQKHQKSQSQQKQSGVI